MNDSTGLFHSQVREAGILADFSSTSQCNLQNIVVKIRDAKLQLMNILHFNISMFILTIFKFDFFF